jgi:hypothetical protein
MSLFDKLMNTSEQDIKVPIHGIMAALQEWSEGAITRQQVIDFFELEVTDEADLDWMKSKYDAATDKIHLLMVMHRILLLGEIESGLRNSVSYAGTFLDYDQKASFVARINAIAV